MFRLFILAIAVSFVSCSSGAFKEEAFYVRGNCNMCKERLESGIQSIKGVAHAKYNVKEEMMDVSFDTTLTDRTAIEKKCAELGHGTETYPMNEQSHEALPECCKVSHHTGKH